MEDISENNPHLEEMKERGWAWIQKSIGDDKYGAPYTDDEYAKEAVDRLYEDESDGPNGRVKTQELMIVWWD